MRRRRRGAGSTRWLRGARPTACREEGLEEAAYSSAVARAQARRSTFTGAVAALDRWRTRVRWRPSGGAHGRRVPAWLEGSIAATAVLIGECGAGKSRVLFVFLFGGGVVIYCDDCGGGGCRYEVVLM
ncbi:proline-rich receptor-like protein kinase PERK9 [Iris pallida]|uniref:Proline-rich receptor-like protein kinase PERK9 n=1 Tax=Iris pallida TaxID=29817 RepID=A0AAX6HVL1_IRIPA|nr:proline-rich receptor-like protein kinase PERK9 [Iris pallida]KAJ6850271.1 proline-rich receptor-like protein kinase PERK9 [Iris pallida]